MSQPGDEYPDKPMSGWEALRTLSLIRGLTHVVQAGTPSGNGMAAGATIWESIAAFNCEAAALNYLEACRPLVREYRVKVLEGWDP